MRRARFGDDVAGLLENAALVPEEFVKAVPPADGEEPAKRPPSERVHIAVRGDARDVRALAIRLAERLQALRARIPAVERAVLEALGSGWEDRVDVRVVWDPPWTPEMLTEDAAAALGFRR